MKLYHASKQYPKDAPRPVVALGNFDGVHLAHQAMFALAGKLAASLKALRIAYTFNPHPVRVLSKAASPLMINTLKQKLALLKDQGLDGTVLEPFDKEFATWSAKLWFEKVLVKNLRAQGVVAGYDFTFGKGRQGTIGTLKKLCETHNIKLSVLPAKTLRGTLISSSQIRQFIATGKIKEASDLLGRPFFIEGKVAAGMGRGQTIGIPTANLKTDNEIVPPRGVYVCRAEITIGKNIRRFGGVTNIGLNPTFNQEANQTLKQAFNIETHLFNFKQNIYGKNLKLEFLKRLRDEKKFSSPTKLVAQIQRDIQKAKSFLGEE